MPQLRLRLSKFLAQKRIQFVALGLVSFIALVMIASALLLPSYVKRLAIEQTQQKIGRQLEIADLSFSPFTLTLTANGVNLLEADKKTPLLKLKKAELSLSISSLFHGALVMDEVQIDAPTIHVVRTSADGHGRYNFSDILDRIAAMPKNSAPFLFSFSNVQVQEGAIQFDDLVLDKHIRIDSLKIGLPFLSNFPSSTNSFVQPHLSAKINGAPFALQGRSKPFVDSLETSLAIDIDHLDLTSYVAYLPAPLPVKLQSAKLSTKLDLIFDKKNHQSELFLSGDVRLDALSIQNKAEKALLKTHSVNAHVKQLNVFTAAASIDKLHIDTPEIWLALDAKGLSNWNDIAHYSQEKTDTGSPVNAKSPTQNTAKPLISIGEFLLDHGHFNFTDAGFATPATPVQTVQLNEIKLSAKQFSTALAAKPSLISLAAQVEKDQTLSFAGEYNASTGDLTGNATANTLQLGAYQAFVSRFMNAKLSGVLSLKSQINLHQGQLRLDEMGVQLRDFLLVPKAKSEGQLAIKSLRIDRLDLNTETRLIHAAGLIIDQLEADIRRDVDAKLSLQKILVPSAPSVAASVVQEEEIPQADWIVSLQNFAVSEGNFSFEDHAVSPAVITKAQGVSLSVVNLSSDFSQAMNMKWASSVNRNGKLSLIGSASPKLRKISIDLDGQALPVASMYPYFSHLLKVELLRGSANVKGKLGFIHPEGKALISNFEGMLSLNDFQIQENGETEDFLYWKSMSLDGVNLSLGDTKQFVFLRKLGLNDFYTKLILSEKGELNLSDILVKKEAPRTPTSNSTGHEAAGSPIEIRIEKTSLSDGNINFKDNYIKPNYSANLTGVSGSVGSNSSIKPEAASVQLSGKIDDEAPLLISGTVNPLSTPIFLDIKGSASDIQLTRLSQYASKYTGYPIVKGHLSVAVTYRIENQKLIAENNLKLDQLTLGERVNSPDATSLPVNLALALLRDNDGKIALNLPISGSLSDPQFSLGGIIFNVFMNVITKAVTSPFALLGSMFGGGEELAYGEFLPGRAELTPATIAKLDSLAKALKERSNLKLDITGRIDPKTDSESLRLEGLDKKISAIKLRELRKKNPLIQANEVVVEEMDRKTYIEEVYRAEKMTKQRNFIGIAKTLVPQDSMALVLGNMTVTPEDLRFLAQQRAEVVLDYMEQQGGIEKERLFLIAPKLDAGGIEDKGQPNRVDFSLK